MKIRMTRTENGSPDGFTVREYKDGHTYDVPDELADAFFKAGAADPEEAHQAADDAASGENSGEGNPPAETPTRATRKRGAKTAPSGA